MELGRSFESVRLGVKNTADRWMRARRAMHPCDRVYAERIAEMATKHSSEGFYAFEDPLEAAIFSVLVELIREIEKNQGKSGDIAHEIPADCRHTHATLALFGE